MKTRTINIYQFEELSDRAKENAREWFRRCSDGDTFWSESVIEDAQTAGKMLGIEFDTARGRKSEPAIYWSGFCHQGQGACFAGSWRASAVEPGKVAGEFTGDGKSNVELRRIAGEFERIAAAYPDSRFSVTHRGHYSHEMSTSFECDMGMPDDVDMSKWRMPEDDAEDNSLAIDRWADDFPEDDLIEAARDFMRWIYSCLETEYEYQNSDACVDENICANEYEFTESGELA